MIPVTRIHAIIKNTTYTAAYDLAEDLAVELPSDGVIFSGGEVALLRDIESRINRLIDDADKLNSEDFAHAALDLLFVASEALALIGAEMTLQPTSMISECPNGPDPETGEWLCDPKGYFGVFECQTCGWIGPYEVMHSKINAARVGDAE